jgi:hypothetical protein
MLHFLCFTDDVSSAYCWFGVSNHSALQVPPFACATAVTACTLCVCVFHDPIQILRVQVRGAGAGEDEAPLAECTLPLVSVLAALDSAGGNDALDVPPQFQDWVSLFRPRGDSDEELGVVVGQLLLAIRFTSSGSTGAAVAALANGVSQFEQPNGTMYVKLLSAVLKPEEGCARRWVDVECQASGWESATSVLDNADSKPEWRQGFAVPLAWDPVSAECPVLTLRVKHAGLLGSTVDGVAHVDLAPFVLAPRQVCVHLFCCFLSCNVPLSTWDGLVGSSI